MFQTTYIEYKEEIMPISTPSKWERNFFVLILGLVHHVMDVLLRMWIQVNVLVKKVLYHSNIQNEVTFLENASKLKFQKVPSHIAVAFLETSISLQYAAKIILWSMASGAQAVSMYDLNGFLKSHIDELKDYVAQLQSCTENKRHIEWNKYSKSDFSVNILSRTDGLGDIVEAARHLAESVSKGEMESESINERTLGARLSASKGMPDPEVLLRFGLAHSNQGFPPWQLRLSEIHDLDTHHGVTKEDFYQILLKYSGCQQRFGR